MFANEDIQGRLQHARQRAGLRGPQLRAPQVAARLISDENLGKSDEKFFFAKFPHNPLKRLISDERIQGIPRKSKARFEAI